MSKKKLAYRRCGVPGCGNNYDNNPNVYYHFFPSNNTERAKWLSIVNNPAIMDLQYSVLKQRFSVCSVHFDDAQYQTIERKKLNRNARPTILNHPFTAINRSQEEVCVLEPLDVMETVDVSNADTLNEENVEVETTILRTIETDEITKKAARDKGPANPILRTIETGEITKKAARDKGPANPILRTIETGEITKKAPRDKGPANPVKCIYVYTKIVNLIQDLRKVLPEYNFIRLLEATDKDLRYCEVIIGDLDLLVPFMNVFPQLKWVQATWSGEECITQFMNQLLRYKITRYCGKFYGQLIAEHVLASIVNQEREFLHIACNRKIKVGTKAKKIGNYRPISSLTVGILGVDNSIGSCVSHCLHLLGATILGYERKPFVNLDEHSYSTSGFTNLLKASDYIVNVLPHDSKTIGFLNDNVLENCKEKTPFFINVGSESVISEEELIKALNENWISGASLDVFSLVPLRRSSSLWTTPKVYITPHDFGISKTDYLAQQFQSNLKLYLCGKPIPDSLV